jgi:hypothetical protein
MEDEMKSVTCASIVLAAALTVAPGVSRAQAQSQTPTIESICDEAKLTMVEQAACRGEMQLAASEAEKIRIRLKIEEKLATSPRAADEPKGAPADPPVPAPAAPL